MIARRLALAFGLVLLAGCGVTRLQSARTTPRGDTRTTIGASLVHLGDRGFTVHGDIPAVPLDIMVRHGATDRVDWGIRLLFGLGLLGDVKWNLLDPARATALSVSAGVGGGGGCGRDHPRPPHGQREPQRASVVHPLRRRRLRHLLGHRLRRAGRPASATRGAPTPATAC